MRTIAWNKRCSLTVKVPTNKSSCCTYAVLDVSIVEDTLRPLAAITPEAVTPRPERNVSAFNNVVFPAPDDPIITNNSPGYATPHTAITFFIDTWKVLHDTIHTPLKSIPLIYFYFYASKAFFNPSNIFNLTRTYRPSTDVFFPLVSSSLKTSPMVSRLFCRHTRSNRSMYTWLIRFR